MSELKKELNLWDSIAIITAIVVGVGIFRVPAEVAALTASSGFMLLAWFFGGVVSLLGALCYAELSAMFPGTGGNYLYFRESYGRPAAFLFGWAELLVIRTGSIAAVAFISSEYMSSLLSAPSVMIRPLAVLIVLVLSLANIIGLKSGKMIHNSLTVLTIGAIVGIMISGLFSGKGDLSNFQPVFLGPGAGFLPLFGLALIPVLWTYGGWHENTFVTEETKDAARTLPRALILGVSFVTLLYLAVNAFFIYLVPVEQLASSPLIGSDVFYKLHGLFGRRAFETVIVLASLGGINAMLITGSRITYAMADDNRAFAYLEKVSSRFGTPHRSIIVNAFWASLLIVFGTFERLLFFTGILVWFFFALAVIGLFVLRKKYPGIRRPYKVWGYPIVPAIFILICIGLFLNTLFFNPAPSVIGLFILASGLPVYLFSEKIKKR